MIYLDWKLSFYHLQRTSILGARVEVRSTDKLRHGTETEERNFEAEFWQEACAASCLVAAAWLFLICIVGVLAVALLIWLSTLGFIPRPWYGSGVMAFDPNNSAWNDSFVLDWVHKLQVGQPQFNVLVLI